MQRFVIAWLCMNPLIPSWRNTTVDAVSPDPAQERIFKPQKPPLGTLPGIFTFCHNPGILWIVRHKKEHYLLGLLVASMGQDPEPPRGCYSGGWEHGQEPQSFRVKLHASACLLILRASLPVKSLRWYCLDIQCIFKISRPLVFVPALPSRKGIGNFKK